MPDLTAANLASLVIIDQEINVNFDKALEALAAFDRDMSNNTQLKSAIQALTQIDGALRMAQLDGAHSATNDLLSLCQFLLDNENKRTSNAKETVHRSLEVLPRYLQLVKATRVAQPALLIPLQNDIRRVAAMPPLAENHYATFTVELPELPESQDALDVAEVTGTGKRLRQMYQTGLIGVLRDDIHAPHLTIMQRACTRMAGLIVGTASADLWRLGAAVLEALLDGGLELTSSRVRWLSNVDKGFRDFLKDPQAAINEPPAEQLVQEMLYLIAMAPVAGPLSSAVRAEFTLPDYGKDEKHNVQQRQFIYAGVIGLDQTTAEAVRSRMTALEAVLQNVDSAGSCDLAGLQELHDGLGDIISQLHDFSGTELHDNLLAQQGLLAQMLERNDSVENDELLSIADVLLGVNASLAAQGDPGKAFMAGDGSVVETEISEAEAAVIEEAHAGISLSKRAITSYVESDFDPVHMGNIAITLDGVRGALAMLGLSRAAGLLQRCNAFVESSLEDSSRNQPEVLETLADALISVEYYLSQLQIHTLADESVLDVADESLADIGFPADV